MIMDTNKCIACQSCTIACKTHLDLGQGPGVHALEQHRDEARSASIRPAGTSTSSSCSASRSGAATSTPARRSSRRPPRASASSAGRPRRRTGTHPNIGEDEPTGNAADTTYVADNPHSMMWMYYLQRICNHCTYPACVAACPREAIYKRPEDGIVLVDQTRCRGYQECLTACPYKKTMFNLETRVSEKCIGCYPKIEQGLQTQCTTSCIGRLRLTNFLSAPDEVDPRKPADFLVHVRKIALPIYPQLGLEPNVYYIPPVHVPTKYLTQMFGPGVEKAVEMYRNAKDDPELLGLLMLFGATERIMDTLDVTDGVATRVRREGRGDRRACRSGSPRSSGRSSSRRELAGRARDRLPPQHVRALMADATTGSHPQGRSRSTAARLQAAWSWRSRPSSGSPWRSTTRASRRGAPIGFAQRTSRASSRQPIRTSDAWNDADAVPRRRSPRSRSRSRSSRRRASARSMARPSTTASRLRCCSAGTTTRSGRPRRDPPLPRCRRGAAPDRRRGRGPALTMGAPGSAVHILQWRATWQRDIDSEGTPDVDRSVPRASCTTRCRTTFSPPRSRELYWVGREAGNPLSQNVRTSPVEEIVAEGFGSVTHLPEQTGSRARRPRRRRLEGLDRHSRRARAASAIRSRRAPSGRSPLRSGSASQENRGGRKHIANWQARPGGARHRTPRRSRARRGLWRLLSLGFTPPDEERHRARSSASPMACSRTARPAGGLAEILTEL